MSINMENKDGELHIEISGHITKFEVTELHYQVLAKLQEKSAPDSIRVETAKVADCDTAGLQLLLSVRKTAEQHGIPFALSPYPWPRPIEKAIERNAIGPDEFRKPVKVGG